MGFLLFRLDFGNISAAEKLGSCLLGQLPYLALVHTYLACE
jgi:hypothetical protein